jgi:xanthine dehydrogenase accessory factor
MQNELKEIYKAATERREAALTFTVDGEEYLRSFRPPERLILLGCGNIGQELCRYASDLGFTVTAVDERPSFANRTLMPDAAEILCSDFPDAIRRLQITERDYVCVITRGHRFDADCLREILPGAYPRYLGMIGSKRRVALLLRQLESEGFDPDALKLIHAPIGISINALTVKEIAISIVAELIQCRRTGLDRRSRETRLAAEDIDLKLLEFLACEPTPKALLLVYDTSGSTPVKSGAMMAVDKLGRTVGTIGGGCGESAVLTDARRIIGSGLQRSVTVDISVLCPMGITGASWRPSPADGALRERSWTKAGVRSERTGAPKSTP